MLLMFAGGLLLVGEGGFCCSKSKFTLFVCGCDWYKGWFCGWFEESPSKSNISPPPVLFDGYSFTEEVCGCISKSRIFYYFFETFFWTGTEGASKSRKS